VVEEALPYDRLSGNGWLIPGGFIRSVDNDDFDRSLSRLQLETKLFLYRGEERRGQLLSIAPGSGKLRIPIATGRVTAAITAAVSNLLQSVFGAIRCVISPLIRLFRSYPVTPASYGVSPMR